MLANDLYTTTQTHTDFPWPRLFERRERPALPPLRTGERMFCSGLLNKQDVTPRVCVEEVDCIERRSDENRRVEKKEKSSDDGCVLMSRKKAMTMNKDDMMKFERRKKDERPKTTYQTDYVLNDLSYDDLMDQASKASKDILKRKCRGGKYYLDPIPFKKKNDKKPMIG